MQRTIHLDHDNYRLADDGIGEVDALVYDSSIGTAPDYDDPDYDRKMSDLEFDRFVWVESRYKTGARAVLVSRTDVSPNAIHSGRNTPSYYLHFDLAGVGGNSDHTIRRTSGWRGTTNDVSCDAHGIVRITKIRELKSGVVAVTVKTENA